MISLNPSQPIREIVSLRIVNQCVPHRRLKMSFQVLNLDNVSKWCEIETLVEEDGFQPRSMLTIPIYNSQRQVTSLSQRILQSTDTRDLIESNIKLYFFVIVHIFQLLIN